MGSATLPLADSLRGHTETGGKFLLCQMRILSRAADDLANSMFHVLLLLKSFWESTFLSSTLSPNVPPVKQHCVVSLCNRTWQEAVKVLASDDFGITGR